jgi:hypothetical protein
MGTSNRRVRPGLIWVLVGCFLLSLAAIIFLPEPSSTKKARVTITRAWERDISVCLKQRAETSGGLTNIDTRSIVQEAFGANSAHSERFNSKGEILDYWKMPFQIEILAQTNIIIRSAGPNRQFNDKDDIVFDSTKNDFVKP